MLLNKLGSKDCYFKMFNPAHFTDRLKNVYRNSSISKYKGLQPLVGRWLRIGGTDLLDNTI